jgi:hypothetical protein
MKDQRLQVFRLAVEGLLESLDAFVRVSRWSEPEPPPEPLRTATDVNKVTAMCLTMKRLDAAYVAYRQRVESVPDQARDAVAALEIEIGEATASSANWR